MYLNKPATVDFDPNKKDHRAAFRAFMKRKAWTDCSMRFTHDPGYGSIAEQVQAKMLHWYIAQDEAKEGKRAPKGRGRTFLNAPPASKELAFQMMGIASELPQGETHAA